MQSTPSLRFQPVTPDRMADIDLFSRRHGKFRYCSCMRWRMRSTAYSRALKEDRVATLERLIRDRVPIGVLAYADAQPIGWCSIAPRESYEGLERYRALARIDDKPVWSVARFLSTGIFAVAD